MSSVSRAFRIGCRASGRGNAARTGRGPHRRDHQSRRRRRQAHTALAAVLDGHSDADRAVWHRAMATPGPDEEIADELEASARRSQSRGGHASAVTALERAAPLSSSDASLSRRLTVAVEARWFAGQADLARDLVDRALDGAHTRRRASGCCSCGESSRDRATGSSPASRRCARRRRSATMRR